MFKWGSPRRGNRWFDVFCNDVGDNIRYEVKNWDYIAFNIDNVPFGLDGKITFTRTVAGVEIYLWEQNEQKKEQYQKKINKGFVEEYKRIYSKMPELEGRNVWNCTDARIIRAYILAYYELAKKTPADKITELLNKSSDWSRQDAREWLRINDFYYNEDGDVQDIDPPNANYLYDSSKLIDPYWEPNK